MKFSQKQMGALAALVVAVIAGALTQTGADDKQETAKRDAGRSSSGQERVVFRDAQRAATRERNQAGEFDYYSLVLSWSPAYCASKDRKRPDRQCEGNRGRPYAFVLHGLWPQYHRGYPESCWTKERPFVPRRTIDGMLDIMPNPGLVIHEYKKHGTCSGLSPRAYFALSRELFEKIKMPARFVQPTQRQMVSPQQVKKEFAAANPDISANMVGVVCRGAGNRLREVRFCFTRDGKPMACGRNEIQDRLCRADRMFVPPVRASR